MSNDVTIALADVEAAKADLRQQYGDRAPVMRDINGRYLLIDLWLTWANLKKLEQQQ
jgi:hypothetical protein